MQRLALAIVLVSAAAGGCNRGPTVVIVPPTQPAAASAPAPAASTPATNAAGSPTLPPIPPPELSPQERYNTAVWSAVNLLADRKLADALAALETAQKAQDTEQVRREIARVKRRIEADKAAERTARDIQAVLNDGKPEEAARLAAAALREFADTESAAAIARLNWQAEALVTLPLDPPARAARFHAEGDEWRTANQPRVAVVAYEQAAAAGDTTVRKRLVELEATLARYDDARRRAAELRRDPTQLADALAALQAAAAAWDNPQVRREIDDCTLAVQTRPDRLGVADFEILGDINTPLFGRTVAEELLPAFKGRFELVAAEPLTRICNDLRLQPADMIDRDVARREIARLARVRYVVVGSVAQLGDVIAHARLLDLQTGLVVQTARISAPTPEKLVPLLPQLAGMLQMSDEQRQVYERQVAAQSAALPVAADAVTIPPPPGGDSGSARSAAVPTPPDFGNATPPPPPPTPVGPIVVSTCRPPEPGGVTIDDFRQLPQPGQVTVDPQAAVAKNHKARARAINVAVEVGDDLFRRGRFAAAQAQFQIALGLAPRQAEIVARLERCKASVPNLLTAESLGAPGIVRARAAVLDFVTDNTNVPGAWVSQNVAPYLLPPFDVADRGEVDWYLGRLGVTLKDVVTDPLVRFYLGRALNVRFMVLGTLRATPAGLEVVAHLLDVETGTDLNSASTVAGDRGDLKCRLGEIGRWLLLDPAERLRRETEAAEARSLLVEADAAAKQSNFSLAIELTKRAGQKAPGIRVEVLLSQLDRAAQWATLDSQRRATPDESARAAEVERRQQEVAAAAAEAARAAAKDRADLPRSPEAVSERQQQREAACQQLIGQARAAAGAQNFAAAIQLYESALAINRRATVVQDLADVRTRADEQSRGRFYADAAVREAQQRQARVAELFRVRNQLDQERRQKAAAEEARSHRHEKADPRARAAAADAERKTEQRLKAEAETRRQADARAKAEAEAKVRAATEAKRQADEKEKADAEAKTRAETEAKMRAEAEARRLAEAKAKAEAEARLKAEEEAKARAAARPPEPTATRPPITPPSGIIPPSSGSYAPLAPPGSPAEPIAPPASFTEQMEAGAAFEKQDKYADAVKAYKAALRVVPSDRGAARRTEFAEHMDTGLTALKADKKAEAVREFEAALRIAPKDAAALKWLQEARR
jgi:TolB-like protein